MLRRSLPSWVVPRRFFSVVALSPPITNVVRLRLVTGSRSVITHPSSEWFSIGPMDDYLTPTSRLGLDGFLMPTDWWMIREFKFPPFGAVVLALLVYSSVCPTEIRRSRPIRVARA